MIDKKEFDIALAKQGLKKRDYIQKSKNSETTFYNKYNGKSECTVADINEAVKILKLDAETTHKIFLLYL